jgi:hypothetical protein
MIISLSVAFLVLCIIWFDITSPNILHGRKIHRNDWIKCRNFINTFFDMVGLHYTKTCRISNKIMQIFEKPKWIPGDGV